MESFVGRSQDVFTMKERRKRRMVIILICIACIIAAAAIFAFLINIFLNRKYEAYEVVSSEKVSAGGTVKYAAYNDLVLKYSRDGISAQNASGEMVWNGSYDMTSPVVDICKNYVAVADIGDKKIMIYSGSDSGTEMTMDYPIVQVSVASNGVIAVLQETGSSNVIGIYNPYGVSDKLLAEIPTNVEEGYPVCMDISNDGVNLAAAYVSVTSGNVQSRVSFYDFSSVGKNTNCLVGAKNYDDRVVSDVRFLNDSQLCMFSDKGFSIWEHMKKPQKVFGEEYKSDVKSAFCNGKYVGFVYDRKDTDSAYHMKVYDLSGKTALDIDFKGDYSSIQLFDNDEILLHTGSDCEVYRINGVKKFSSDTKGKVLYFMPAGKLNRYYLVTGTEIQKIKLKN